MRFIPQEKFFMVFSHAYFMNCYSYRGYVQYFIVSYQYKWKLKSSMVLRIKIILLCFIVGLFYQINLVSAESGVQNLHLDKLSVEDGLTQSTINSILADKDGFIWLATDNGINIYDGYSIKQIPGPNNSFMDTSVDFIKQDSLGFIWISVDEGLYRYHPETNQYKLILANSSDFFWRVY